MQCRCQCWTRLSFFPHPLCSLSFSNFSYSWKMIKNPKSSYFYRSFCWWWSFISQNKSISLSNANLFCSYNIISSLLTKFRLVVEHGKTEVFHFSRSHGVFNPPPLDLTPIGGPVLLPKATWWYLGFFFDQKLTFWHHINFYANKAISTIKYMRMLGNLSRRINPLQRR